jgi:hypothetical protein
MMPRKQTVVGVTALFIVLPFLSAATARGDDWQPIDPGDLAMKDNPKDPGADAMILYRERFVDENRAYSREYVRMKIFTKEGLKYANVELTYVKGSDKITAVEGRTIHADGSVVNFNGNVLDKVVVKAGGVKLDEKAFSLPDVQPGSIIEYRYQDQLDEQRYYISLDQWTPQGELFSRLVRFSIKPLGGMAANGLQLAFRTVNLPEKVSPERQRDGSLLVELHDIPGVAQEELMPPDAFLRPRVEFFYRNPNDPKNETQQQYWTRIDKNSDRSLEKFIEKEGPLRAELARITAASDSADQKLQKMYARAQQIRNISFDPAKTRQEDKAENLKPNNNAEDVLKHGYGNEAEINMLFIGLARAAGFDATQVWVASTNSTLFTPQSEEVSQLSTDLVWLRADGHEYYLDPGARFYPFGLLPWTEAGTSGIRLRKDAPDFINTPPLTSADAGLVRNCDIVLGAQGDATGTIRVDYSGEFGALWRMEERDEDDAGRKKDLADDIRGWLPAGSTFDVTSISNWDDVTKPLHVEGTFKISAAGMPAGSRLLVPLTLFRTRYADVFKPSTRSNPVDFDYPFEEVDTVTYHVPKGYSIESVPTVTKVDLGAAVYQASVTKEPDTVEIQRHLAVAGIYFPVKSYSSLRFFFNKVQSNDQTQIVLRSSQLAAN